MDNNFREINFKFGDLFKGIGSFIDLLSEMVEEDKTEFIHKGELGIGNEKGLKGIYNLSVKLGALETEKNKLPAKKRIGKKPEPIFDIFDEGEFFIIIIEIPGVSKEDLIVSLKNNNLLIIQAPGSTNQFCKEIPIPENIPDDKITWNFKNNILEVRLWKV
ncbi:MAG: Hsp20/alpha crystallin family protein [Dethiobacter sp.]|jgi:HSP20 family protein|nr:MAG: Hsp20/alpha crystallin family protein [Dethiobacter sp.]